jgi:uncharacterized CHY-type Zn-finger protein
VENGREGSGDSMGELKFNMQEARAICGKCKTEVAPEQYYPDKHWCKSCNATYVRERSHRLGIKVPLSEAKDSASYLGVWVAERALSQFFDHMERMPYGTPGYDFICGRGFKIDVKSSCLHHRANRTENWNFMIRHNAVADYFLCIAFNDRVDLEPMHVWLIPGEKLNGLSGINIRNHPDCLALYESFEQPLNKVISCCNKMKIVQEG